MSSLIQKFNDKTARIGIIGLGYVGLPLMLQFVRRGFETVGFDIDAQKIEQLNKGHSPIRHIKDADVKAASDTLFKATADFSQIADVDAIIVCVPTPLNKYREPDLSFVIDTLENIAPFIRAGQVLSLESTTYPGTTVEEIQPRIEAKGFTVGKDYHIVYSPEREDPGNPTYGPHNIPKICGGVSAECSKVGQALYEIIVEQVVPVSSTQTAEMAKLLENIHRSVNIGLMNEMKMLADKMGVDIFEVIEAAATKPFGFTAYYPGPGIGGHCIPIDPFYLTWKAREFGMHTRFIELAGEINGSMPKWVVRKLSDALNKRKKTVNGSKILILGIAYKKNVDDVRESPSIEIMERLQELGADISYSDPHAPVFPKMRAHHFDLESVEISADSIAQYDAVVLCTSHDDFDYDLIAEHAQLVIDTRGVYRNGHKNVVAA